jgi:hypothetical protein
MGYALEGIQRKPTSPRSLGLKIRLTHSPVFRGDGLKNGPAGEQNIRYLVTRPLKSPEYDFHYSIYSILEWSGNVPLTWMSAANNACSV